MSPMAPGAPHDDLQLLAKLAKERRLQLGIALNDKNAQAGGTSKGSWQRVERGEAIRKTNYIKIDGLLRWAPGSCIGILEGKPPIPVSPSTSSPGVMISDIPPEAIDEQARDVVQLAAIATTSGLTADEIRALSDRVVKDLRERGIL